MTESSDPCCKVGRAIQRYDLEAKSRGYETFDDRLTARWTGEGTRTAQGYRPLTVWFNKQLLKREYDEHGVQSTGTRLDREYEILTGDDDLQYEEVRDMLRSEGVDVEAVESQFVSWSSMQRHLNNCLGVEKQIEPAQTDWERNSVEIARERLESKLDDALRSLSSKGEIEQGDQAEVSVSIELSCPECPLRVPMEEALDRGYVCEKHLTDN